MRAFNGRQSLPSPAIPAIKTPISLDGIPIIGTSMMVDIDPNRSPMLLPYFSTNGEIIGKTTLNARINNE